MAVSRFFSPIFPHFSPKSEKTPIRTHFQKSLPRKAFRAKKPDFKRLSAGTGLTETTPKRTPPSQLQKRLEIFGSSGRFVR